MNICDSCKKFATCGVRIDGIDRHSCIWGDPITRADLAAKDAEIEALKNGIHKVLEAERAGAFSFASGFCMCGATMPCNADDHPPTDAGEYYMGATIEVLEKLVATEGAQP